MHENGETLKSRNPKKQKPYSAHAGAIERKRRGERGGGKTHSLASSSISTFFWHPVVGLAMFSFMAPAQEGSGEARAGNVAQRKRSLCDAPSPLSLPLPPFPPSPLGFRRSPTLTPLFPTLPSPAPHRKGNLLSVHSLLIYIRQWRFTN
jgi:hypothetical protein